jgi:cytochrome d ubiquinol oxidase subunit II
MLHNLPLLSVVIGLILYTVLAGADFGAGFWQLTAGNGPGATEIRSHAHDSMAPVWEANHVWLIFVLTVFWTAYPAAFGSIASTAAVPLFIAALGIIFRGAAYALLSGSRTTRETRIIETIFAISSVLTPFALGTVAGAIGARRIPVGNARGDLFRSWLGPTSVLVGVLAVAISAFLAAVYLCGDAARVGNVPLQRRFRARALGAGVVAGALALGGLAVLHSDADPLFRGLVGGLGIIGLIVSALSGAGTLALVWWRRFALARYTAALAVTAIIAGWALAQRPVLLPGLTVSQAAAPASTLVPLLIAVVAGAALLFPALALLFGLFFGRLGGADAGQPLAARPITGAHWQTPAAAACLVAGFGLLTVAETDWAHLLGVLALLAFVALGFLALASADTD